MDEESLELLKIIGLTKTVEILEYFREHGTARHHDLSQFVNMHTLNSRICQMLKFKLIEHHYERIKSKREWYTLTEKGKKVLEYAENVAKLQQS
jgi:DNA-binding HxlR family transcriptional regulator